MSRGKKKAAKKAAAEVERLQAELSKAMESAGSTVKDAVDSKKKKKKKKGGKKKFLLLAIVGALVASEDLRGKLLDALFGAEEEFQYTPPAPAAAGPVGGPVGSA